jgi:hypothetical protein
MKRLISGFFLLCISYISYSQTEINLNSFPLVESFKKSKELKTFNPDNLWDYINGAADLFLKYDFEKLYVMKYEDDFNSTLTAEIYQHSNNNTAYGIFSSEKYPEADWVNIGAQGYYAKDALNFYNGIYYVKLMSYKVKDNRENLIQLAEKIDAILKGPSSAPTLTTLFPEEGKIKNSDGYVNKNFLGYSSLSKAFTTDYKIGNLEFRLFIIEKNNREICEKMIKEYLKAIKVPIDNISENSISIIKDPYQGKIGLFWIRNKLFGTLNLEDENMIEKYLNLFKTSLDNQK